ncbi:MAG: thioredoxin family protein [Alistipes sp.]|nr:thioredoxin family protein [Alistipes sp.]MBR0394074.1 thioredoxin family protein [Alistipes sp.]
MRKFLFTILALVAFSVVAQAGEYVKWSSSVKDNGEGNYTLIVKADIAKGWHIYDDTFLFNPTTLTFNVGEGIKLVNGVRALSTAHKVSDPDLGDYGEYSDEAIFEQDVLLNAKGGEVSLTIAYQACTGGSCTAPEEETLTITLGEAPATSEVPAEQAEIKAAESSDNGSLWALIIEAILWGLAAIVTPCVFPMVPMTVSFFMKSSTTPAKGRLNASLYGLFIVLLYTLPIAAIILITRILGGDSVTADIFNWLATHWLPNLIFFVVFMIFAASFFGAFEITLPSWLVNKSDEKSDKGGVAGIFFMALTLVLVSFSCTGPIVGSVLVKSTSGEFWSPILTMLAFSTTFALPFTLFAFFPSMLKKLPKSGGWLNSVKVVLGFVEVALGFKFLSVADQVYHWGLLDREIYLAIWIVVFSLLGLYLLGKIRFAHDSEVSHLSVGRLALAVAVFSFVVYLIPGMWGAPLSKLSGYLPPLSSQDFVLGANNTSADNNAPVSQARKYSDTLHLPHGLEGFFDLAEAEAYAKQVNKPIFIDFTGHGCVNCREMEARVWSDATVQQILRDEYVLCALYTDDRMSVPESDWVVTEAGKTLKSLGQINAHYQLKRFGANAQPYYVLQGRNGDVLIEPRSYDLDVAGFIEFLRRGVEEYKK